MPECPHILLLSFVYFPPANTMLKERTGFVIPRIVKIVVGIFIIWATLGVGELFDKIDLIMLGFLSMECCQVAIQ